MLVIVSIVATVVVISGGYAVGVQIPEWKSALSDNISSTNSTEALHE